MMTFIHFQLVRSEAFLICLHIGAIVLGVTKEALDYRHNEAEDLEIAHTTAETTAVILIIVIRIVSIWHKRREIIEIRKEVEHMDEHMLEQMHGGALTSLCITFTVVAVIMAVFALVTLILFYFLAHLGWTVLSNNFALVIVTVLNGLLGKIITCNYFKVFLHVL